MLLSHVGGASRACGGVRCVGSMSRPSPNTHVHTCARAHVRTHARATHTSAKLKLRTNCGFNPFAFPPPPNPPSDSEQQRNEVAAFLQERHVSQGPFPLNTQHSNPHTPVFDTGQNPTFPTVYPLPPTHRPPTRLRFRPLMQTQARMQARARGHRLQERLHLSPPGR